MGSMGNGTNKEYIMNRVEDIREKLVRKFLKKDFVEDKSGVKTIELIGESFIADEDWIVRRHNLEYVDRELDWYHSTSLNVNDIPGETPKIWKDISSSKGEINSNYGNLIFSEANGQQYEKVLAELKDNPNSRRATMIYNRPSMHTDYNRDGMSDFICTYGNQFMIRNNKLISHYIMRSNDAVFGYCNDVHWAMHVHKLLAYDLNIEAGDLIWTASNFHIYERHFKFVEKLLA
jgi:thymidylate synthase